MGQPVTGQSGVGQAENRVRTTGTNDAEPNAGVYQLQADASAEQGDVNSADTGAEVRQPSPGWMMLRELAETIILSLVIFLLIRQVVQNYRIESHSMQPNFYEGQFILVNKLSFRLGAPARGDVIVFHNPSNVNEDYIKRVIGLPGDTVEIRNQAVYINGEVLVEDYDLNLLHPSTVYGPLLLEPSHLFVMGDNRQNSKDSRDFGALSEDLVVGKAWLHVWPLATFGWVDHYDLEPGGNAAQAVP
ncbi:MAG: signal peptidase I [Litorilinea sp.]